jgi:alpha-glucosidase
VSGVWWQRGAVYQIYPRSFADSNGDGVGDLDGIRRHLDHLQWLGVDALWVSPFFRSPMADFGYDVADYCDVDPLFGSLADADALITEAHERDLRLIVDLVPNHTSDEHPWFVDSRSSRRSPRRDWYIWRDPGPDGAPPNNWMAAFTEESAWTFDQSTGQHYLHLFLPQQPDLNWANPEVEDAMHGVMRFWLDRGVDGFRVDVIHAIGKDPALPDDDPPWDSIPHCVQPGSPETHIYIRRMRALVDSYPGTRVLIGETAVPGTNAVAPFYGARDELHLAFNFAPMVAPWDATAWRKRIMRVKELIEPVGWPTWVLSNHDNARHRTRYGGSEARARAAALMLLTLRGTPFIYAGEEIGQEDAIVPDDRIVDPGGRDGCRAPIPWDGDDGHGWGDVEPWLPFPPHATRRNVADVVADDGSIVHLYRRGLELRRNTRALHDGELELVPAPEGVVAYERRTGSDDEVRLVVVSFASQPVALTPELRDGWIVELASDGSADAPVPREIPSDAALLLRRR